MPRSPSPGRTSERDNVKLGKQSRPKKEKSGGIRWKEKKPAAPAIDSTTEERPMPSAAPEVKHRHHQTEETDSKGRGRNEGKWTKGDDRDRRRSRSRSRSPAGRGGGRKDEFRLDRDPHGSRSHRNGDDMDGRDKYRDRTSYRKEDKQKDWTSSSRHRPDTEHDRRRHKDEQPQEKKVTKPKKKALPEEPMIVVNVNDRLGTKASIPCRASDPIRLFKALVAAQIGRAPHEIMITRQGERPFNDKLTLADYSVSNGVQLDLEVDTGD